MDSVSEFIYDYDKDKYGFIEDYKISYNEKYLALGTKEGENDLGWKIIYDLATNSIYNKFLERDSSEISSADAIDFSRNDSFLVTIGGEPEMTKIWDFHTGTLKNAYELDHVAHFGLEVSPDNTKIIESGIFYTVLLRARWTPVTTIEEVGYDADAMILYPNPVT